MKWASDSPTVKYGETSNGNKNVVPENIPDKDVSKFSFVLLCLSYLFNEVNIVMS